MAEHHILFLRSLETDRAAVASSVSGSDDYGNRYAIPLSSNVGSTGFGTTDSITSSTVTAGGGLTAGRGGGAALAECYEYVSESPARETS